MVGLLFFLLETDHVQIATVVEDYVVGTVYFGTVELLDIALDAWVVLPQISSLAADDLVVS